MNRVENIVAKRELFIMKLSSFCHNVFKSYLYEKKWLPYVKHMCVKVWILTDKCKWIDHQIYCCQLCLTQFNYPFTWYSRLLKIFRDKKLLILINLFFQNVVKLSLVTALYHIRETVNQLNYSFMKMEFDLSFVLSCLKVAEKQISVLNVWLQSVWAIVAL